MLNLTTKKRPSAQKTLANLNKFLNRRGGGVNVGYVGYVEPNN